MKSVKTFAATVAAGAAIAAGSLLAVAAPASAATQPAVQNVGTAKTASPGAGHAPDQRPIAPQQRRQPVAQRPASPSQQRIQQEERQRAEKQARQAEAQKQQQQSGQSTDPGQFLPNPPIVTPVG